MRQRIDQLEAELKAQKVAEKTSSEPGLVPATFPVKTSAPASASEPVSTGAAAPQEATVATNKTVATETPTQKEPFSDADWTWLNGNPRTKEIFWDSKFFTPEIRADTVYVYDFNHPTDHSMGGSSELFRSQEVQLDAARSGRRLPLRQRSRANDDAVRHVFGNDAAERPQPGHGQWDLVVRVPLLVGSVRRVSLRRDARGERGCGNFPFVHRPVQLLQFRQLGLSAVVCFLEHAMVFRRRARADFPHGAFED